jgi:hypothetical protein
MALSDKLNSPPEAKASGLPCSIGALLASLPPTEVTALEQILSPELGWTATQVYDALTAEGYKVGFQSISRHRGGRCRCVRGAA